MEASLQEPIEAEPEVAPFLIPHAAVGPYEPHVEKPDLGFFAAENDLARKIWKNFWSHTFLSFQNYKGDNLRMVFVILFYNARFQQTVTSRVIPFLSGITLVLSAEIINSR